MNSSIIISILSVVGFSHIFSQWIKIEFELLFYYSCLFSIFILYISGLTNTLETAVILLRWIGLAGLLLFISTQFRKDFKITYGMIFLIVAIAFLLWSIKTTNSRILLWLRWLSSLGQNNEASNWIQQTNNIHRFRWYERQPPCSCAFSICFQLFHWIPHKYWNSWTRNTDIKRIINIIFIFPSTIQQSLFPDIYCYDRNRGIYGLVFQVWFSYTSNWSSPGKHSWNSSLYLPSLQKSRLHHSIAISYSKHS